MSDTSIRPLTSVDRFNERRITALAQRCARLMQNGDTKGSNRAWNAMVKAIERRSPVVVEQLERERKLRPGRHRGFRA